MSWSTIFIGIGMGVSRALVGFVKNKADKSTPIDWNKAAPALIVGAAIGFYSAFKGIDLTSVEALAASMGATYLADDAWKIIKKLFNRFLAWISK